MAARGKKADQNRKPAASPEKGSTRVGTSMALAKRGIQSSEDYRNLLCALMTDVIQGNVTPQVSNAATNAGRALVRMVELEYKMSSTRRGNAGGLPISRRVAA